MTLNRRAAALFGGHLKLEDALARQRPRHILLHLLHEPFRQPADFGALERIFGQEPAIALQNAMCLVEIFGDDRSAAERPHAVIDVDRQGASRVQSQEIAALFPGLFLDQLRLIAIFRQDQTNEPGRR